MPRYRHSVPIRVGVTMVAGLVLSACTLQEPEFTTNDQVPAEFRVAEAATDGEGGGGEGGEDNGAISVTAIDIEFPDPPSTVPAGDVTFQLVNEGVAEHNLLIEELGDELIVTTAGGETDTGTATLEPGIYTLYCNIPGHRPSMEFEVEATES